MTSFRFPEPSTLCRSPSCGHPYKDHQHDLTDLMLLYRRTRKTAKKLRGKESAP